MTFMIPVFLAGAYAYWAFHKPRKYVAVRFIGALAAFPLSLAWLTDSILAVTIAQIYGDGVPPFRGSYRIPTEETLLMAMVVRIGLWSGFAIALSLSNKNPLKVLRNAAIMGWAAIATRLFLAGIMLLPDPGGQHWQRINSNFSSEYGGYDSDQNWMYIVISAVAFVVAIPILRVWAGKRTTQSGQRGQVRAEQIPVPPIPAGESLIAEREVPVPVEVISVPVHAAVKSLPPAQPVQPNETKSEPRKPRSLIRRALTFFAITFVFFGFLIARSIYNEIGGMAGISDISEHISPSMKPVVEFWLDADLAVPMNWTDARPILPPCPNPGTVDVDRALHDRKCSVILDYNGDRFLFIGWEIPARDRQAGQDLGSVVDEIREQRGSDYVLRAGRLFDPEKFFASPFHERARTSPPQDNASVANDKTPLQPQGNGAGLQPERALENDPAESKGLNIQGLQLLKASNPDLNSVKSAFEKAVQLDPTNIQALNNLGYTYSRLGDFRSAEPILIKVLEMAPTRKVAQGNLGYVEAKLGKTSDAANHFCEYVRLFDSMDRGKTILKRTMTDNDSNVQIAVNETIAGCGPQAK
jgi:hypothetical protein